MGTGPLLDPNQTRVLEAPCHSDWEARETTPALCRAQGPLPTMELLGCEESCAGPREVQHLLFLQGASQAYFLATAELSSIRGTEVSCQVPGDRCQVRAGVRAVGPPRAGESWTVLSRSRPPLLAQEAPGQQLHVAQGALK